MVIDGSDCNAPADAIQVISMNRFGVTYLLKGNKLSLAGKEYNAVDAQLDADGNVFTLQADGQLFKGAVLNKTDITSFTIDDDSRLAYMEKEAKSDETIKRLQAATTFTTIVYRHPVRYTYINTITGGLY